jgi:hypothetical protein
MREALLRLACLDSFQRDRAPKCRCCDSPLRVPAASLSPIPQPGAMAGAVWQFTYLKALPGQRERLEQFLERNWFVMDARAKRAGYLVDNHLPRGSAADTTWDLLEISVYADSLQHARIDSIFRAVIRPQHNMVTVDGFEFRGLGRFVREETMRWRAKSP